MGRLFGLSDAASVTYTEVLLGHPWPAVAIALVVAAAAALALYLYHRERSLPRWKRLLLGSLRAVTLAVLVLALFDPRVAMEMIVEVRRTVLVLLDTSESMATRDARREETDLREAAMALGHLDFGQADAPVPAEARPLCMSAARIDLARGLLGHPARSVFQRLGEAYTVRYFGFGEHLEPAQGKGEAAPGALVSAEARGRVTRLGSAVQEAVDRSAGEPVAGVIVLTDGISNDGLEPQAVAERMGQRQIPIYPVGLGLARPPDVRLRRMLAPEAVFHQDRVPLRVEIGSDGFAGRTVDLAVRLGGREVARRPVTLAGRGQFEEVVFLPAGASGAVDLEVSIEPLAGEVTDANNRLARTLRVIDSRIQVLYVEGKPRWEYRYLRQVLLRDPRLEVTFLLTEGDRDQALASDRYLTDFPEEAARAFHFDLVILGDVPATYFSREQLARIEELVRMRGGSFLMLAGHRHAPQSYLGTPVAALLPVRVRPEGWRDVADSVVPMLAPEGADSAVMTLELPLDRNRELWARVRPMYRLPVLEGAKPGATVLAQASRGTVAGEAYPLIAWQRYGTGKTLFVGTDQLWRLRFKQGDKYHARFWGQAITFLTISRLLGESKRVQIESDRTEYRTGQRVQVTANVLDDLYEPVKAEAYTVAVERSGPGAPRPAALRLEPVPGIAGLYQGFAAAEEAGRYVVRSPGADAAAASAAEFTVEAVPLEQLERAMQEDLLRDMARASGGRYVAVRDLGDLERDLLGEARTAVERTEASLWDQPWVFVVLLGLLAAEWLIRRHHDLV